METRSSTGNPKKWVPGAPSPQASRTRLILDSQRVTMQEQVEMLQKLRDDMAKMALHQRQEQPRQQHSSTKKMGVQGRTQEENVKSKLLSRIRQRHARLREEEVDARGIALTTRSVGGKNVANQNVPTCQLLVREKKGHAAKTCWTRENREEKYNDGGQTGGHEGRKDSSASSCWACRMTGHARFQCPKRIPNAPGKTIMELQVPRL